MRPAHARTFQHFLWTLVQGATLFGLILAIQNVTALPYKSEADDLITIQNLAVLPFSDNVQGIYSRPLEAHFLDNLQKRHRWDVTSANAVGPISTPEDLADNPDQAKQLAAGLNADAFIATRVSKGPNGISIVMSLFLTKDAKLFVRSNVKDLKRYDIADLKDQLNSLWARLEAQIPYQGRILSRDNQRVTVNVGAKDGIQAGQVISVVQIISLQRHPKFNFLVSSEKEILGRVKILKVDDTLSFGTILAEKEKGAIAKNAKISGLDFVTYPETGSYTDSGTAENLNARPDANVSFGENPTTWVPKKSPTFGQISARLGDTLYGSAMNLSGVGDLKSSAYIAPNIFIDGELWVTNHINVHAGLRQALIPIKNPRSGASPGELNQQLTSYQFMIGYDFRLSPSLWGANVELLFGYQNYRLYVDSSTPQAYTTMTFTGFKFGISGQIPVTNDQVWAAGAELFMVLMPHLSETPVSSGDSNTPAINTFGLFGSRRIRDDLKLIGKLEFEQYSASFSGAGTRTEPATSSSQRHTTLSGGIAYLF